MYAQTSTTKQQAYIQSLESQITLLQAQLGEKEDPDKIVKTHIRMLHRYNEAKDAAQVLIGRLAALKDTTVRQVHRDLDLPETD